MARLVIFIYTTAIAVVFCTVFAAELEECTLNENLQETEESKGSTRLFENLINATVECLRTQMHKGIPKLRIKTLDPLQIWFPIPLVFRNNLLRGYVLLRKFRLEGLAGFELTKGSISSSLISNSLDLGLNFAKIKLTSKYRTKLSVFGMINLYGKGTLSIVLNNFDIDSTTKVKPIPVQISDLRLEVTLPTTHAEIAGLFNDEYMSKLISEQLTDTLSTLAKEEHERFNVILHSAAMFLIKNKINPALKNIAIADLIEFIKIAANCESSVEYIARNSMKILIDAIGADSELIYSDYCSQHEEFCNDADF